MAWLALLGFANIAEFALMSYSITFLVYVFRVLFDSASSLANCVKHERTPIH
jgi:hypothetical protein